MKYYSAIKNEGILPFATIWLDLEIIMLSEISQRKTNAMISLISEFFKKNHRKRVQICGY